MNLPQQTLGYAKRSIGFVIVGLWSSPENVRMSCNRDIVIEPTHRGCSPNPHTFGSPKKPGFYSGDHAVIQLSCNLRNCWSPCCLVLPLPVASRQWSNSFVMILMPAVHKTRISLNGKECCSKSVWPSPPFDLNDVSSISSSIFDCLRSPWLIILLKLTHLTASSSRASVKY